MRGYGAQTMAQTWVDSSPEWSNAAQSVSLVRPGSRETVSRWGLTSEVVGRSSRVRKAARILQIIRCQCDDLLVATAGGATKTATLTILRLQ